MDGVLRRGDPRRHLLVAAPFAGLMLNQVKVPYEMPPQKHAYGHVTIIWRVWALIKEEFEQYVHNADLGPYISDKCNQHLTLTESFFKGFKFHPRESRVSFRL